MIPSRLIETTGRGDFRSIQRPDHTPATPGATTTLAGLRRSIGGIALCAALAFAAAAPAWAQNGQTETVIPKFDQALPNVPGKSLIVVEVDYAPGAASPPHKHAKSAFIYAYVISGEIKFAGERRRAAHLSGRRELVRAAQRELMRSAGTRARTGRRSCSRSSSSTPTTRRSPRRSSRRASQSRRISPRPTKSVSRQVRTRTCRLLAAVCSTRCMRWRRPGSLLTRASSRISAEGCPSRAEYRPAPVG